MSEKANSNIRFHYLTNRFHFSNRRRLNNFLFSEIKRRGFSIDAINYIFCDDEYLLEVNRKYLEHDEHTDIITFELSPKGQPLLSDIFISIDRVRENAKLFNTTFIEELHRVIFHGVLHLCGYKDKTEEQSHQMRTQESLLLKAYFVSRKTVS